MYFFHTITIFHNINSTSTKFDNLKLIIDEYVDIFCVAET